MTPADLFTTPPHLAALTAEETGEFSFYAVMGVVSLVLFILSLIRLIRTKKPAWIAGLVLGVVLGVGTLGAGVTALVKKAAGGNGVPTVVTSSDHFVSARIPGHWKTLTGLNKNATLQVGNTLRAEFLVVLSESKGQVEGLTLDEYADLVTAHVVDSLENGERGAKTPVTIDGRPGVQYEFKGVIQKTPIVYLHTVVETPQGFHQFIMWTIQSKQAIAFPVFKDVLATLKVDDAKKPEDTQKAPDGES